MVNVTFYIRGEKRMGPKRTIWKTTLIFLHNSLSKSNQPGVVAHTCKSQLPGRLWWEKSIEFKSLRPGWSRKGELLSVNKTAIKESKAL